MKLVHYCIIQLNKMLARYITTRLSSLLPLSFKPFSSMVYYGERQKVFAPNLRVRMSQLPLRFTIKSRKGPAELTPLPYFILSFSEEPLISLDSRDMITFSSNKCLEMRFFSICSIASTLDQLKSPAR